MMYSLDHDTIRTGRTRLWRSGFSITTGTPARKRKKSKRRMWGSKRKVPLRAILMSNYSLELVTSGSAQPTQTAISAHDWIEFNYWTQVWKTQRPHSSYAPDFLSHHAYLSIVAMSRRALPFILRQLRDEGDKPDHWFAALRAITHENPATPDMRGDLKRIAKAWLDWGDRTNAWKLGP